jgi:hypothetical protein
VRFASIESVRESAERALRRFRVPLACAWGACAIFDALILAGGRHDRVLAVGISLTLGIPVCFAITLLGERGAPERSPIARWLPQAVALLALAALAIAWSHWTSDIQWRRYAQLSLLAHALVAFLPYATVREPNGFWQYNRTLLERFVLATIFAGVLLVGILGALASLRPLFGIDVSGRTFGLVSTWAWFVFHPWFFFAGIPAELRALDERRDYPGTVRVFAQFVLVPLVAIYQTLLTAYLLKVVVTGNWPTGLIGWLVSAEAIAGILAILLIHPVRDRAENLWVRTFSRVFYIALVPSIAMLAVSIAKRVGQYGVTEDRYFVIALTVWLGAISVYFIARREGDIRWIPITLAVLALFTFGGPWSAYDVSLASQRERLVRLLRENDMLRDGNAVPAVAGLSSAARRDLSSVLQYLLSTHGGRAVSPVLGASMMAAADSGVTDPEREPSTLRAQRVATRLGFAFMNTWEAANDSSKGFSWMVTSTEPRAANPIAGFEYHARIESTPAIFQAGSRSLALWCDENTRRMVLSDERGRSGALPPTSPVDTLGTAPIDSLIAASRLATAGAGPLRAELEGRGVKGRLQVTQLYGAELPKFRVNSLVGDLYFTLSSAASDSGTPAPPR